MQPNPTTPQRGIMAGLVRAHDWNRSPLGTPAQWPAWLKGAFDACLASAFPSAIVYGPDLLLLPNDAFAAALLENPARALGMPFGEYWVGIRAESEGIIRHVLSTGEPVEARDLRVELPRKGETRVAYLHASYGPLHDERGNVAAVMAVATEITEKVEAEQRMEQAFLNRTRELDRSREFLDSLIENMPNMVFVKDARDLRFVRFNRAGEELIGVDRKQMLGKSDFDFFPREQAEHFVAKDREVLRGREIVDIPEEPITTRNHGIRYLHTRKIPLLGADGTPEYLLGISDDITEKRQADEERLRLRLEEAALAARESARRRLSLLADAGVALSTSLDYRETLQRLASLMVRDLADWCTVTVRDDQGVFARAAGAHRDSAKAGLIAELMSRYRGHKLTGEALEAAMTSRDSQLHPRLDDAALRALAIDDRHYELTKALGAASSIVAPIRGREQVHGKMALMRGPEAPPFNEDDLRTAEELGRRAGSAIDNAVLYLTTQKAVEARDAFLSIASHELKTPLTSLTIQTQMRLRKLKRGQFDEFQPARLLPMCESDARQLNRLNRLIDDMLDVSRIASGKLTISKESVNLLQLVREVAERHSEQFERADSLLSVSGDENVTGQWDRYRIEQVVTNLFSNALKYGNGKPVTATVGRRDGWATLEVADQGIGVAPADQERIFRQFERAVAPGGASGLGLGLYIVKQILDLHEGNIRLVSEPGRGAKFVVSLPSNKTLA